MSEMKCYLLYGKRKYGGSIRRVVWERSVEGAHALMLARHRHDLSPVVSVGGGQVKPGPELDRILDEPWPRDPSWRERMAHLRWLVFRPFWRLAYRWRRDWHHVSDVNGKRHLEASPPDRLSP